jgi:hypothetical protein
MPSTESYDAYCESRDRSYPVSDCALCDLPFYEYDLMNQWGGNFVCDGCAEVLKSEGEKVVNRWEIKL